MCWEMHEKPIDQKPRQNNRNRGYQVSIDHQTDKFQEKKSSLMKLSTQKQMEQLYKMFSSFQTSGQSSTYILCDSLAHKCNFLEALSTISD